MKIIIKEQNQDISIIHLVDWKYGPDKMKYEDCKSLKKHVDAGKEWFLVENIDKSGVEEWNQLYWENEPDGSPVVKKDLEWRVRVMTDRVLKKRHIERQQSKIDAELDKPNPDPITLARLQRECEKCKAMKAGVHNEDPFWIQKAIEGLDEKVAKGESDKPVIREKLRAKLNELNNKKERVEISPVPTPNP